MRKQIMHEGMRKSTLTKNQVWLDLDRLARVELTSESAEHPIESALLIGKGNGWRAQHSGKQTIRLLFDNPHKISRIQLLFEEKEQERTQEFVLSWSANTEATQLEIVRQQYNFSPPDNTRELEDYTVELNGLTMLELSINPNISGGETRASLAQLRLA